MALFVKRKNMCVNNIHILNRYSISVDVSYAVLEYC